MPKQLTPKQESFAEAFVHVGNQSDAYRHAYNIQNMSQPAIHVEASRLMDNPKIALRVSELREEAAARTEITMDRVRIGLWDNYQKAKTTGNLPAANRALELLGKHLGMFKETVEVSANIMQTSMFEHISTEDLRAFVEEGRARRSELEGAVVDAEYKALPESTVQS